MSDKNEKTRGIVITIAGLHGSGRSTQAKRLAKELDLRYFSTGKAFRERAKELGISLEEMNRQASMNSDFDKYLDMKTKEESRQGNVVIDANLSAWMAENPDLKIYLSASFSERVRRIAHREKISIEEAEKETKVREELERKRYIEYYGVDIADLTKYDIIINTSSFNIDTAANILKNVVLTYMSSR
ncbi:cytidylate kinase [Candidatus Bathyarchaeota archaeon]|nr:cytidylate kinase [Candidatus Bathyarchaeota archaeon]